MRLSLQRSSYWSPKQMSQSRTGHPLLRLIVFPNCAYPEKISRKIGIILRNKTSGSRAPCAKALLYWRLLPWHLPIHFLVGLQTTAFFGIVGRKRASSTDPSTVWRRAIGAGCRSRGRLRRDEIWTHSMAPTSSDSEIRLPLPRSCWGQCSNDRRRSILGFLSRAMRYIDSKHMISVNIVLYPLIWSIRKACFKIIDNWKCSWTTQLDGSTLVNCLNLSWCPSSPNPSMERYEMHHRAVLGPVKVQATLCSALLDMISLKLYSGFPNMHVPSPNAWIALAPFTGIVATPGIWSPYLMSPKNSAAIQQRVPATNSGWLTLARASTKPRWRFSCSKTRVASARRAVSWPAVNIGR